MNLVTNTDSEINALFNNSRSSTTDYWETVYVQSMTAVWDDGVNILKNSGFSTLITSAIMGEFNGKKQFDSDFGYFDEGIPLIYAKLLISRGVGLPVEISRSHSETRAEESIVYLLDGLNHTLAVYSSHGVERSEF